MAITAPSCCRSLDWPASRHAGILGVFVQGRTHDNARILTRFVAIGIFWPVDIAEGQQVIDEIRRFKTPLADMIGPMPYRDWQMLFDVEFPHGARYYWKGVLLRDISDEVIDALVEQGAMPELDSHMLIVEHYRGAMNRVDIAATAFPHREAHYQVVITGKWDDPADDENGIAWARRLNATIEPYSTRARFLNFNAVDSAEKRDAVRASFGPNYDRLVSIKRRYDPSNLFRENNNIVPE